ncbi:TPA: NAD-dependent succinate-semialdehyde dehydrogenase [Candidatus Woesearchaeota archaeon]|nr:NAD-dependent succinate-semialdehyde dehydrogenase [Candidatus Woesearchaeota archaeon]
MTIASINPTTNKTEKVFKEMTQEEVQAIIEQVHTAWNSWKHTTLAEKKSFMLNAGKILRDDKTKYARIMTIEMGKPIKQAEGEIEKCALVCEYYAEHAASILKEEIVQTDASKSYVRFDPLGIILAIMPWNFPFWQVFRFAAPALMAGNVGILKHASNVPQCALAIEEVFKKAGFPDHTFRTLLISSKHIDAVIADPRVKAVTLTGSDHAGRAVGACAGKQIKKSVLELGGSDPFIVLDDFNLDATVDAAVYARHMNNGQSCIASKRFIVVEQVADRFLVMFKQKASALKMGDPLDPSVGLGPLAREDLAIQLDQQVKNALAHGATLLLGGKRKGAFYEPTILTNIKKENPAYAEEFFGPVALVFVVRDAEEAIHVANDTPFGLGASIWTRDTKKAEELAQQIEAGCVFVNGFVKSDPRLPFGGVKTSGYGRELSHYGMKEFVNIKTVWIK